MQKFIEFRQNQPETSLKTIHSHGTLTFGRFGGVWGTSAWGGLGDMFGTRLGLLAGHVVTFTNSF